MAEKEILDRLTEFQDHFNNDKLDEVGCVFTDDTVVLPPGMGPLKGKEGALNNMRGLKQMKGVKTLTRESTVIDQLSDDSACSYTTWKAVPKDGQEVKLKELTVWKKHGGEWMILRDMFNHGS